MLITRINGMNTWLRIILISGLALLLLGPVVIATDNREGDTNCVRGLCGALQHADLPYDDNSRVNLVPASTGDVTENSSTPATTTLAMAGGPSASGVSIFPPDHIWNTRVDSLPIDSRSADYVSAIGTTAYLHADFGAGLYEGNPIGIPYNIVNGSQLKKTVTFEYADESDSGPYPIPDNPFIEGGSDHHLIIIDRDAKTLYELYGAEKLADASWTAGSGAIFNLSGYMLRPSGWTSADAAGLAIFPGLVRYDEVNAGEINHALRFTAPATRRAYIWPARHFASSITDPAYPPMGQRFRLKSSFNTSGYPYQAQIVLNALKKYGMILSDNGAPWYITGAPDEQWNNDDLHTLHQLTGSDFEAVDSSPLMINPDSGQALIHPVVPTPTNVGVFRSGGNWFMDMNNNGVWNGMPPDKTFSLGKQPGDIPITGDWNGDNITETGIFRSGGSWYLDMNNNGAWDGMFPDRTFSWGKQPGDIPITGDWNGDNITETGIFRNGGSWYLDMNNNGAWDGMLPDRTFSWGKQPCDIPITGDWNGDNITETGIFRTGAGFYLDMNNNGVWDAGDKMLAWRLQPDDTPVTWDWNGDSITETGIFRNGDWYLDMNNNGYWDPEADMIFPMGQPGDKPVTGKW